MVGDGLLGFSYLLVDFSSSKTKYNRRWYTSIPNFKLVTASSFMCACSFERGDKQDSLFQYNDDSKTQS